jgi:hypothetical protein
MPQPRKSSRVAAGFVLIACSVAAAYFAFFRNKGQGADSMAIAHEPAVRIEVKEEPAPPPPPPKPVPPPAPQAAGPLAEVRTLMDAGKLRDARASIAGAFGGSIPDPDREALGQSGLEINRKLLLDAPDERDIEYYEIRQGDTLEGIARWHPSKGTKGILMLLNGLKESSILKPGHKVKITKGTWSILVDKTLFKLFLCYEGAPFKTYTVAIGTDPKPTPAGKYAVGNKNPKPGWFPPADLGIQDVPVKYGDPRNPLGEWWIALDHDLHRGIGIHGTNDPGSVGAKASNGCVRMLNDEVGEIAAIAYKGMTIAIVE